MRPFMRIPVGSFVFALLLAPAVAFGQVRVIAIQGDPAPGVPAATFTAFPTLIQFAWSLYAVCNGGGNVALYANTSTGVNGLWSDEFGPLAPMALTGGTAPWLPGTGTFQTLGQPRLDDVGSAVFLAQAMEPAAKNGLWYQNASGLTLAAGDGVTAPYISGTTTFIVPLDPANTCLSRTGHLAILGGGGSNILWSFDPPPSVNRFFCAATGPLVPTGNFTAFQPISFNDHSLFGLALNYWDGSNGRTWMSTGACGLLGPVLSTGDLAPPARIDIPASANIASIATTNHGGGNAQPDLNDSNAVVFDAQLVNGGVTSADDNVVYLHDATGFHVVMREGDTAPELAAGETLEPYGIQAHPELVADDGSAILPAQIMPSGTFALLMYHRDRTLHVLARDGAPVPGLPGRKYFIPMNGSPGECSYSMNRYGQVLFQCSLNNSTTLEDWVMMTNASNALVPVLHSGDTVTVRTGLTGSLGFHLTTFAFLSNGSDGRVRNFSDLGEYVFRGIFTPNGSSNPLDGVFAVKGPDFSTAAVARTGLPTETRLAPVVPNPASGVATIAFDLARAGAVRLEIYDVAGRRVRTLRAGSLAAGRYVEHWSGDDDGGRSIARGAYFVRLRAPNVTATRRMVLLR